MSKEWRYSPRGGIARSPYFQDFEGDRPPPLPQEILLPPNFCYSLM
ncbi:MAG: hypothetical protein F6K30_00375 [Cyanothece sp. SIO2G6]|nr:hypothetical protein [Cyanothece sp. SIO2G6]